MYQKASQFSDNAHTHVLKEVLSLLTSTYFWARVTPVSNHHQVVLLQLFENMDQQFQLTGIHMDRECVMTITKPIHGRREAPLVKKKADLDVDKGSVEMGKDTHSASGRISITMACCRNRIKSER